MKILILGGSGILSTDFTEYALNMDNELYILNRGKRKANIEGSNVHHIIADLRSEDVETLTDKISLELFDVVVDFLSFNVEQLKKTLEIVSGRFKQFVFISSATAYRKSNVDEIITEKTEIGNKNWDYAFQKAECECYLRTMDFNYTIIRPYVTFGVTRIPFPIIPDGYHYTLLERIEEEKPVILYNNGEAICTLTSTKDFAVILYNLLLNEKAFQEDFHITSPFRVSWKEVYETYCKILDRKPNAISVSIEQIDKYMPEFSAILKGDKGVNMCFDNSKVMHAIGGYTFEISLFDRLKTSVEYFKSNQFMQGIDYKWDGRCDYLIKKEYGITLKPLNRSYKKNSNSVVWYYIMSVTIVRFMFDKLKRYKRKLKKL